eukprot:3037190-Pyramimonas_sp.AAC.1
MWPGDGILGTRRTRSGLQLAPGVQNMAREWCSGNTKNTKWPTADSGHSKSCPGIVFWDLEDHEVCNCLLNDFRGFSLAPAQTPLRSQDV